MSTASGIKSGMAYVAAYLDDNPVTQGLTKLRAKLISWQSSLGSLGSKAYGGQLPGPLGAIAHFAASPAGIFTGLLAAAKHTASVREEMLRLSQTAGVSVETLSAASYAARKYGVSVEALAAGLKRMQTKEFTASLGGGKGGAGMKGFSRGMFAGLGQGDAMDRMIALARQMEGKSQEVQLGMAKAAGMSDLLPMLRQGADALQADIAHAKELGVVLSGPDADAAERFGFAFADLRSVIDNAVAQIGGALVPMLTGLTRIIVKIGVAVRDWIKEHKALTMGLFMATAAIVAGGLALKVMAVGLGLVGTAVTVVKVLFAIASGVVTVFNATLAAGAAIAGSWMLPFIAIGAVIVGFLAYVGYVSGAFDNLGKQWKGFSEDTSSSVTAISNALAKGDIEAAWNVVTAYLKTEWQRLKNTLSEVWEGYVAFYDDAVFGIAIAFSNVCATIHKAWNEVVGYLQKKWLEFSNSTFSEAAAGWMAPIMARIYGVKPEDVARNLREDMNRRRAAQPAAEADVDRQTAAANARIERDRRSAEDLLGQDALRNQKARADRLKAMEDDLAAKKKDLTKAQEAANTPAEEAKKKSGLGQDFAGGQGSVVGSFSGAVAAMLGAAGSPQERQAESLDSLVSKTSDLLEVNRQQLQQQQRSNDTIRDLVAVA
jgi:hypothetical protein